jgi:cytochrome c peroxidase
MRFAVVVLFVAAGCSAGSDLAMPGAPGVALANGTQVAVVGAPFHYDATQGGHTFTDPRGGGLRYTVGFGNDAHGLVALDGKIDGSPLLPVVIRVTIVATDVVGATARDSFAIVAFAAGLTDPSLPIASYSYDDAKNVVPSHFVVGPAGSALALDNTPATNPISDAGATLGRVLFYDTRLSSDDRVSCASCHQQQFGFTDTVRFSRGVNNGQTSRHTMALANSRFYQNGRFFWDERAPTLEAQVLQPIQDPAEMGMTLSDLAVKIGVAGYYQPLFEAAYGSNDVTTDRIARSLAQFVRSLVSSRSRFDSAFTGFGVPSPDRLTAEEYEGDLLFKSAGCARCHRTNSQIGDHSRNTGLDATSPDTGAGRGEFKTPSLRNVALRGRYMHDGRFNSLDQVITFYDSGVQDNPGLDAGLRGPDGRPARLGLTSTQRAALVAYLGTLTDRAFVTAEKFSDPFKRRP